VILPVAVAFSRSWPEGAAGAATIGFLLSSVERSESGTLGAGIAWLVIVFGLAAWSRRPWPWLAALVLAAMLRDVRTVGDNATDAAIDLIFVGFVVLMGRMVHRRTVRSDQLAARLRLAETESETRTAEAIAHERAVIARELHDIVAHSVSLMVVQAGTARPRAEGLDRELAGVLETIEHTGREALTELRRLLHVLRPDQEPDLQPLPDLSRLDDLVEGVRHAGGDVHATVDPPPDVPPGVALCVYRVVQEGLTNAMRHANGSRIDVDVTGAHRGLRVRVRDLGGTPASSELGTGTGLVGLRQRVLLCEGRMTAGPDGSGFLLDVELPLSPHNSGGEAQLRSADGQPP
jgi:signal transduction histidine kinase